jgi:hypothetical protein
MNNTVVETQHFHRQGFLLVPNPFGVEAMRRIEQRQYQIAPKWEEIDWPADFNRGACQFFMVGEELLQAVESPELIEMACRFLDCDQVHVGACGLGDASQRVSADGRLQQQVQWHVDGGPDTKQVSVRTALDRHDASNAPLRLLPGSHTRPRDEVMHELLQLELATGRHNAVPEHCFARHPHEIEVHLDPRWSLVWTPSAWHATGIKTAAGPRRAMAWNYYPAGGRKRDLAVLKHVFADAWQQWSPQRQRLWGLV